MFLLTVGISLLLFQTTTSQLTEFTKYQQYGALFDIYGFGDYRCPDNIDCVLNCYGDWACSAFDFFGPKNAKFTINCDGNHNGSTTGGGCPNMNIYAENSTELHINVYNNEYELTSGTIYTPLNQSTTNTFIRCGIIGSNNANSPKYACSNNNIYSINGWKTVAWTYDQNASWSLPQSYNTMHCGDNYLSSCSDSILDGYFYRCTDTLSICDYDRSNQTRSPTPTPTTKVPTQQITTNPTTKNVTTSTTTDVPTFTPYTTTQTPATTTTTPQPTIYQSSEFTKYQQYGALFDIYGFGDYRCPDNIDCVLNCYGYWACSGFQFFGPKNAKFTINCDGHHNGTTSGGGCANMNIYADNSTELHINVHNNEYELTSGIIYTPLNQSKVNTFIRCGIIGIYNSNSPKYACSNNNIYSINGWETVEWTYDGNASWSLPQSYNTMHCGNDYLLSCSDSILDGYFYRCTDTLSICDYDRSIQTRSPTPNPTTRIPTFASYTTTRSPTKNPTKPPTKYLTQSPTKPPTQSPISPPTKNPTATTATVTTREPTLNPSSKTTNVATYNTTTSDPPTHDPTNIPLTSRPTEKPTYDILTGNANYIQFSIKLSFIFFFIVFVM